VAQAFDPAGIIKTVGAPSFALFAKGGSQESLRSHAGGLRGRTGLRDGRSPYPASLPNWHSPPASASSVRRFSTLFLRPVVPRQNLVYLQMNDLESGLMR
jgi:hypothetical protein